MYNFVIVSDFGVILRLSMALFPSFFSPILPEMGQLSGSMAFTDPSQSVPKEHSDLGPFFVENISFGKILSTTKTKNKDKIKKIKINYDQRASYHQDCTPIPKSKPISLH